MASFTDEAGVGSSPSIKTTPDNYTALDDFLLASNDAINKPDVRELLIKTYGDQGITGFLTLTGAVKNAGAADQVEYFEEERRHTRIKSAATGSGVPATGKDVALGTTAVSELQDYDVILDVTSGDRFLVRSITGGTATLYALNTTSGEITKDADQALIGNMYPQGHAQPTKFRDPGVERRQNPFMIVKERFQVTGSQATNIGYINTGNGDYRWFMYGEQEARKRFLDKREMMMLFAGQVNDLVGDGSATGLAGSEGYFTAVQSRGNVWDGGLGATGFALDIDQIIAQLDKQGAPAEYAMYVNRELDLQIDDKLAAGLSGGGITSGLPGQFGAFNNSPDMAVQLGFKSFTRGGYTFHKHDWKLLNDPTLLAGSKFQGAMVPMTKVADPRTGAKSYALEMNYKSTNGYDRELNHWVTGGAVLGYTNNGDEGKDVATFHYRSECNLVTRAANQHVIFTK